MGLDWIGLDWFGLVSANRVVIATYDALTEAVKSNVCVRTDTQYTCGNTIHLWKHNTPVETQYTCYNDSINTNTCGCNVHASLFLVGIESFMEDTS